MYIVDIDQLVCHLWKSVRRACNNDALERKQSNHESYSISVAVAREGQT
jgi:hypothetical protein